MALMLQVDPIILSEAQHKKIAAATRKYIDVIGYMLHHNIDFKELP